MRGRGLKQQLLGNERINNSGVRRLLRLKIERTSEELDRKTIGLEFVKREFGISSGIQRLKDWTSWRGSRATPKRGKNIAQREEAGNVEALASTTTERIDRCRSGRAHVRRERWQWLESDHRNPEKPTRGNTEPESEEKKKTLQAEPSEERER
jgi:hypothetical protein